jgi:DNA-binding transcriptional regulator YhcF (GntR family)
VLGEHSVSSGAKVVATAIALHLNTKEFAAWPSIRTLQSVTGLARSTVQRSVSELERCELLTIEKRCKDFQNSSHVYRPMNLSRTT